MKWKLPKVYTRHKDALSVTIFFRYDDINEEHDNGMSFMPITFLSTNSGCLPQFDFHKTINMLSSIFHESNDFVINEIEQELGNKILDINTK